MGSFWSRHKVLIVFWLITLVLIVGSQWMQGWEANLPNRFTAVRSADNCPLQVTATYPTRLFLPSLNLPEQTLVIQVANAAGVAYQVSLEKADWFVLYDKDGKAIPPQWSGKGNAVFTALVKAYPDESAGGQKHRVNLVEKKDAFSCSVELDGISLESLAWARWRIGGGIFARNIALPLGLLSAIVGWVISYLGRETDKAEGEFREKLSSLSDEFTRDPFLALTQCIELGKYAHKKHLDIGGTESLETAVRRLLNDEVLNRIAMQLSALAEENGEAKLLLLLEKIVIFHRQFVSLRFDEKIERSFGCFEQVHHWLTQPGNKVDGIDPTLLLWDALDIHSAGLVVYLLNRLPKSPNSVICARVKNAIEQPHRKRLIRYKPLEWMIGAYSLTLPGQYEFVYPGYIPQVPGESGGQFAPGSSAIPFFNLFSSSLLKDTWAPPQGWENVKALDGHSSFLALNERDADLLACQLWFELWQIQQSSRTGAFVVYWEVPTDLQSADILDSIAHRVAETWIEFLSHNPYAFLDLRPEDRHVLAVYLAWHVSSLPALITRLKQFLVFPKGEKEAEAQLLLKMLQKETTPYGKENHPSAYQLLDWLMIRPPWLEHTVLILVHREQPKPGWQRDRGVYQKDLLKRNLLLKEVELAADPALRNEWVLNWNDASLIQMLKLRVQRVTAKDSFTSLFVRPPVADPSEYDLKLVRKSDCSLSRMLELGQQILLHHAKYHVDQPDLLEDDFQAIEPS